MKNYIADGCNPFVAAPSGGVSSGDFVVIGALFGVAQTSAVEGADVPLATEGVFSLPKTTGEAWTQGQQLYWVTSTKKFTTTPGANISYGTAHAAAASGDTSGEVTLAEGLPAAGPASQQAAEADLAGTLTGTADGTLVDVAATAGSCAGGSSPSAANVDTAIATAVASIVTGVNTQNKEFETKINAILAKLRLAGILADA